MSKLKYVALHITEKCSHNCSFCYYRKNSLENTGITKRNEKFSLATLKSIVNELIKNQVEEVFLLGGDPAEYLSIFELAKYASEKGLIVTSISNTHEYNCELDKIAPYITIGETTIHGGTKELHDSVCGVNGAYNKVLSNLKKLKEFGCSTGITINLMPLNIHEIYDIVKNIIDNFGNIIDYINVQRIVPYGRSGINDNNYLQKEDVLEALKQIERVDKEYNIEIQCEDAIPLCLVPERYWKFIHRCEWGFEKLSLNGNGGVSRCGADPRYNLGNILETPLAEIWNNSPILKEFRQKSFLPPECQICSNLERCGGGCVVGTWEKKEFGRDILLAN